MNKAIFELLSDDEFKLCYDKANSFSEFYKNLGYSSTKSIEKHIRKRLKSRMKDLNLAEDKFSFRRKQKPCLNCGVLTLNKKFCSLDCSVEYKKKEKIEHWKQTGDTGCQVVSGLKNCIRDYILQKQNYACAICGLKNEWNNKKLNFILDHIDGDASNNNESNLRLICPNCDSQLDTYKSKNKNSARNFRKKYSIYNK